MVNIFFPLPHDKIESMQKEGHHVKQTTEPM